MADQGQTLSGDATLHLPEFDSPPAEPWDLLREWWDSAVDHGVREPYAAVLATADEAGRPSTRVLLMKEIDARGLIFTSFRDSRKGRELQARPWASATFHWRETLRQLTVAGEVETLTESESEELFALRPLAAQATTAVSQQSHPLDDEEALRERARKLIESGDSVERPAEWTGYRLVPQNMEFWCGSPDRLHRRLRYDRSFESVGEWTHQRLQP